MYPFYKVNDLHIHYFFFLHNVFCCCLTIFSEPANDAKLKLKTVVSVGKVNFNTVYLYISLYFCNTRNIQMFLFVVFYIPTNKKTNNW